MPVSSDHNRKQFSNKKEQQIILQALEYTQSTLSLSQAQRIKKMQGTKEITFENICTLLGGVKKGECSRVIFKNEQLYRFFPRSYSAQDMRKEILEILRIYLDDHYNC